MALEEYFEEIAGATALAVEAAAVAVVAFGAQAFVGVVGLAFRSEPELRLGREVWLRFAV